MPEPARPQRVFLLGMMGAGKSVVGAALADRLGWLYLDNDRRLHDTVGLQVDQAGAALGRRRLHELEREQAVRAAGEPPPLVAGLAASVVEQAALAPTIRAAGWCVYLRARPETLVRRVGSGLGRPWLAPDPAAFVRRTLRRREPLYRALADLIVNVDDAAPDQIAADIAHHLGLAAHPPE
ncbi:MAG: serine transporter [Jiangellaceae bacterium]|nr:serine transporter [Jiangellaceae bacterium]